jgi:hypothetical protein
MPQGMRMPLQRPSVCRSQRSRKVSGMSTSDFLHGSEPFASVSGWSFWAIAILGW